MKIPKRLKNLLTFVLLLSCAFMNIGNYGGVRNAAAVFSESAAKNAALQMTATLENSTTELQYNYAEYLGDGRGITFGAIGFCTGIYDGNELIKYYTTLSPNNNLAKFIPALNAIDAGPHNSAGGEGSDSTTGLTGFIAAVESNTDPLFRQAQLHMLDELYWDPAHDIFTSIGAKNNLTMAFIYDMSVRHGADGAQEIVDEATDNLGGTPGNGVNENTYLSELFSLRDAALDDEGLGDTDRDDGFKAVLSSGNVSLSTPFAFTAYGDSFTIKGGTTTTTYTLTVSGGTGSGSYASGVKVTITAAAAPTGKVFDKWTGSTTYIASATSATTTVTMPSSAITLIATYKTAPVTTYTLTVSGGSGSGSYASGAKVTITAAAAPTGKVFDKWTGSTTYIASATSATTTVTMPSSAITLTATYKTATATTYVLTVSSGTGSGSYAAGTQVTINAAAAPTGKVFDKWTGSTSYVAITTSASTTVTMPSSAITLTATYKTATTTQSSAKSITAFTLAGVSGTINETSRTIGVNLPAGTSLTSIAPTITVSAKATVSPTSGTARSFTSPVIYTVTAEDGSTQSYVVTVTVSSAAQSSAKAITAFILGGKTGVINETDHSITVSLPSGTNVTALVPDIYLSVKSTVSPASGAAKNYTNPVNYIVTAENGTIQAYVVTVIVGASTNNTSPIGTITYSIKTPTSGSVIATLVPSETVTVTSTGGFTHTFTQNGTFTFTFTDSDGNTGSAIATVNNIDKATPTITLNGSSTVNLTTGTAYNEQGAIATDNIDGSVGVVTSGSVNANTAGTYIITYVATDAAGNVTTATRTVKVTGTNTTTSANALLTFAFKTLSPDVFGIIDETNHTVLLTVPAGTNLTALVPTIRVSDGATVSPSSETAQNFTTPKTYTVTSSTGAKQTYTVTVKKETINLPLGIFDGDIIQCKTSFDPFAVYIVKIVGDKIFIRHIVSLQIFNYYKHLQWANLKQVSSLEPYSLSGWVRVNTGSNGRPGANDKVYEVNGDQTKHWINMTAQQFLTHGGSDEAIFTVNSGELKLYKTGVDVMSL